MRGCCSRMIERGVNAPLTSSWEGSSTLWQPSFWAGTWWTTRHRRQSSLRPGHRRAGRDCERGAYDMELHEAGIGSAREPVKFEPARCGEAIRRPSARRASKRASRRGSMPALLTGSSAPQCNCAHRDGIKQVAISGGCMHNRRLTRLLRAGLEEEGFDSLPTHRQVSPGDGGLSYGQAAVAAALLSQERANRRSAPTPALLAAVPGSTCAESVHAPSQLRRSDAGAGSSGSP